jgi:hypothetical protein
MPAVLTRSGPRANLWLQTDRNLQPTYTNDIVVSMRDDHRSGSNSAGSLIIPTLNFNHDRVIFALLPLWHADCVAVASACNI